MSATQIFHTAARQKYLQILNAVATRPATWYVLLRTLDGVGGHTADAAAADTLSSNLNEVSTSGTGYGRQSVTNDGTHSPVTSSGADYQMTLDQVTFSFTGAVTGITHAAVADTSNNSGVLWWSAPLAATRNVANGDTLKETFVATLTQG